MEHKEITKNIRNEIAKAGIKARVWMQVICGEKWIQVRPITFETDFTANECKTIKSIAKANNLTHVRGLEIDENLYTCREQVFVFHG
mgnify:CR=1 FL=1